MTPATEAEREKSRFRSPRLAAWERTRVLGAEPRMGASEGAFRRLWQGRVSVVIPTLPGKRRMQPRRAAGKGWSRSLVVHSTHVRQSRGPGMGKALPPARGGRQYGFSMPGSTLSATRRTSATHQRPAGFFSAQWQPPVRFAAKMASRITERPLSRASRSMSALLWPKQWQISSSMRPPGKQNARPLQPMGRSRARWFDSLRRG